MKEKNRKLVIGRINEDLLNNNLYETKKDALDIMSKSEIIKEYEALKKEVLLLSEKKEQFGNNLESIIDYEFGKELDNTDNCRHEIWLYEGTYSSHFCDALSGSDSKCHRICSDRECDADSCSIFLFKKYVCLDCGWEHASKDWKEFEKTNFVLKSDEAINVDFWRKKYFEILYKHNSEDAKDLFIKLFNNEKEKVKVRK